jgi:hypothetical protein
VKAVFLRLLESEDKAAALKASCSDQSSEARYALDLQNLRGIPGSPFAYWLSADLRQLFGRESRFRNERRHAKQGLATSDDDRFVRYWYEAAVDPERWRPIAKGRGSNKFYSDIPEVLTWENSPSPARELKAYVESKPGNKHWSRRIASAPYYGRSGITWPLRAARFTVRALPEGCAFSLRGYSAFVSPPDATLAVLGLLQSSLIDFLYKVYLGRFGYPEFLVGVLPLLPMYTEDAVDDLRLSAHALEGWSLQRSLDTASEVSHAFVMPAVLHVAGGLFKERAAAWAERVAKVEAESGRVQCEIDDLCFDLYGISKLDRRVIAEGFGVRDDANDVGAEDDSDDGGGDSDVELDPARLAAGLVSWAVGVAVGRFDVRLATGVRTWPEEPDPFDPLPVCSPAMLAGQDGLPLDLVPEAYPVEVAPVLVDDPGNKWDFTARVRAVFDVVFGDDADRWWRDVGAALDPRSGEVENWLRKGAFDHHFNTYSKSRRKAPILWPLGTKSGSYRVWLYAHRATQDSLFRVLSDVIEPKAAVEQRRLADLVQEFGPSPSASQRRTIVTQGVFVSELRELHDEVAAVAPLWAPDLNDGVVIVLAPLWRLFAHHRAWSAELKSRWTKLAAGDYDWAHLAMHIWPERVVPRCAEDRSLAIAHQLEDVFWAKDPDNPDKWRPRETPTIALDQLATTRTNPTVQAARVHPNP